jgi:hypothetical protein
VNAIVRTADCQQAARGAVGQGGLRDQLGRQIEIEIGQRQHEWGADDESRQVMEAAPVQSTANPQSSPL